MAGSGYLFGQLFVGMFDWAATISGFAAILASALGGKFGGASKPKAIFVIALCGASITGVGFDAYDYYKNLHMPGNYFGWFLKGPYVAGLLIIGWHCFRVSSNKPLKGMDALKRAP